MDNYTQLGLAGLALGIIFFIVRFLVSEIKNGRIDNKQMTEKFIKITEENIQAHQMLKESIDANTKVNKDTIDLQKANYDNLTALILEVIKRKV